MTLTLFRRMCGNFSWLACCSSSIPTDNVSLSCCTFVSSHKQRLWAVLLIHPGDPLKSAVQGLPPRTNKKLESCSLCATDLFLILNKSKSGASSEGMPSQPSTGLHVSSLTCCSCWRRFCGAGEAEGVGAGGRRRRRVVQTAAGAAQRRLLRRDGVVVLTQVRPASHTYTQHTHTHTHTHTQTAGAAQRRLRGNSVAGLTQLWPASHTRTHARDHQPRPHTHTHTHTEETHTHTHTHAYTEETHTHTHTHR